MQDYASNTNQVLSEAIPTDTGRESARTVIPQLSHSTGCYHHPVIKQLHRKVFRTPKRHDTSFPSHVI